MSLTVLMVRGIIIVIEQVCLFSKKRAAEVKECYRDIMFYRCNTFVFILCSHSDMVVGSVGSV